VHSRILSRLGVVLPRAASPREAVGLKSGSLARESKARPPLPVFFPYILYVVKHTDLILEGKEKEKS
jgi:hypothetical protein